MSIKLTAQQKAKPIYTIQGIYAITQPILLRATGCAANRNTFGCMLEAQ